MICVCVQRKDLPWVHAKINLFLQHVVFFFSSDRSSLCYSVTCSIFLNFHSVRCSFLWLFQWHLGEILRISWGHLGDIFGTFLVSFCQSIPLEFQFFVLLTFFVIWLYSYKRINSLLVCFFFSFIFFSSFIVCLPCLPVTLISGIKYHKSLLGRFDSLFLPEASNFFSWRQFHCWCDKRFSRLARLPSWIARNDCRATLFPRLIERRTALDWREAFPVFRIWQFKVCAMLALKIAACHWRIWSSADDHLMLSRGQIAKLLS